MTSSYTPPQWVEGYDRTPDRTRIRADTIVAVIYHDFTIEVRTSDNEAYVFPRVTNHHLPELLERVMGSRYD